MTSGNKKQHFEKSNELCNAFPFNACKKSAYKQFRLLYYSEHIH